METHQQLVEKAKAAIKAVFEDTSVEQSTAKESLNELIDEASLLAESLEG